MSLQPRFVQTGLRCWNSTHCSATSFVCATPGTAPDTTVLTTIAGPVHRVWIAIGNEALAYVEATGLDRRSQPWALFYQQRSVLAHRRRPEIDEDRVWRLTALRTERYRATVRAQLR